MALSPFFNNNRSRSIWDPFPWTHGSIFDPTEASSIFEKAFGSSFGTELGSYSGTRVDWVETPEAHVFKADVPGMKRDDIKVSVLDERTLNISGERNKEEVREKDSWRCVERSYGKFDRQFGLPKNANVDKISAKVEDGVLTVNIPKMKTEALRVKSIPIA